MCTVCIDGFGGAGRPRVPPCTPVEAMPRAAGETRARIPVAVDAPCVVRFLCRSGFRAVQKQVDDVFSRSRYRPRCPHRQG